MGRRVRRKTAKDYEKSWVLDPPHWSHEKRRRTQRRMVMLVAGMGDQNTSDVATRIHENVLDFAGLFPESERLSYEKLVPKGRVWAGFYIDDWLCVYFCRLSGTRLLGTDTTRDCDTSARYLQAWLAEETSRAFHQNLKFSGLGRPGRGRSGKGWSPS